MPGEPPGQEDDLLRFILKIPKRTIRMIGAYLASKENS
jgi:hypothetical protein